MRKPGSRRVVTTITAGLLVVLPGVALWSIFSNVARGGEVTDFENVFYAAGQAVADGESPYPSRDDPALVSGKAYVYPPLTALAAAPLTFVSVDVVGFVVMALLVVGFAATLFVLGVRDWRCYALAFLWPPVLSAIQTGNITIPLALAAAIAWRYRDSARVVGGGLGIALAAKPILWPLLVWLGCTRRLRGALVSIGAATVVLVLSWAVIGFAGLADYAELVRKLTAVEDVHGYTVYALGLDAGLPSTVSRALWAGAGAAGLIGVALLGRRGDDRRAFVLAVAAGLALSPIVWQHYFALLLVAVAVAEPRLGPAWFVPLLMYGSTGTLNGNTLQTAVGVATALLTVAVALRPRSAGLPRLRVGSRRPVGVGRLT